MGAMIEGNKYVVFDRKGENLRKLSINFGGMILPVLSPDGRKAIFQMNKNDTFVINLDGSTMIKLNKGFSVSGGVTWSSDGQQIVFSDDVGQGKKLFIINADGTGRKQLTDRIDFDDSNPLFSPDGKLVLFESSNQKAGEDEMQISFVPVDGSSPAILIGGGFFQRWSPDGKLIFFRGWPVGSSQKDRPAADYFIHLDGSGLTQIPENWFGFIEGLWLPGSNPLYKDGKPPDFSK
jgi:hypothetical protein